MRLIALAIGAMTFLYLGFVSLQFQLETTESAVSLSGNADIAFNMSEIVLADLTTTLGVSVPGFFLAAVAALVAVFLVVTLQ